MDQTLITWCYIGNLIAASAALVLFLFYLHTRLPRPYVLPKSLLLFLLLNTMPAAILSACMSILFSLHYLTFNDETTFIFKALRFSLGVTAQHVRGSLLILVIERILSTMLLEKYSKYSSGMVVFVILTIITSATTILYICPTVVWIFFPAWSVVYYYLMYLVIFVHLITVVVAKMLHTRNKRMYVILAYRVSLNRRFQVLENIKVLTFICPIVIIFAVVAPWGCILATIHNLTVGKIAPSSLFLITYNLSYALTIINLIRENAALKKVHRVSEVQTIPVISPLGVALPTSVTSAAYFKDLKRQWN